MADASSSDAQAEPGRVDEPAQTGAGETAEELHARHARERRELQARVTSKKKNATKKTRKGVNEECERLERELRERHGAEVTALGGGGSGDRREKEEEGDDVADGEREITSKLGETSISSSAHPAPRQEEQQPQHQQPGKKRNRQAERLARRAAEAAAASAAAEEEAAGMADHKGVERAAMERQFAARSLVEHDIRPDGHCLFSAVADQLRAVDVPLRKGLGAAAGEEGKGEGEEEEGEGEGLPPYKAVRRAAAAYMLRNPDDFAPFLDEDLDGYARKMRDTADWGGQLELLALARAYGVDICVVQGEGRVEKTEGAEADRAGDGAKKELWLAYYRHGYALGEHYNSLRKKG